MEVIHLRTMTRVASGCRGGVSVQGAIILTCVWLRREIEVRTE